MITMGPPLPTSQSGPPAPLHTVLSQLSFATDIPPDELQLRNTGSVWSGLFCTSFDEDDTDLFFDAQETLIGDGSMDSLVPIRGGHADETSGELSQAGTLCESIVCTSWTNDCGLG